MHIYSYRCMLWDSNQYYSVMQGLPSSSSMKTPAGRKHLSTYRSRRVHTGLFFHISFTRRKCRWYLPEKKMVPRPNRIRAATMHLLTEKPLSSCCRGSSNSSSFSSSSSALPMRSRAASRDLLLLLSCGPTSPAASCSPTSDASVESVAVKEQKLINITLNSNHTYWHTWGRALLFH